MRRFSDPFLKQIQILLNLLRIFVQLFFGNHLKLRVQRTNRQRRGHDVAMKTSTTRLKSKATNRYQAKIKKAFDKNCVSFRETNEPPVVCHPPNDWHPGLQ